MTPGFRAVTLLTLATIGAGVAQIVSLFLRDEPYPLSALSLALLLIAGGAALLWFIARNVRRGVASDEAAARAPLADWLIAIAFAAFAALVVATGVSFAARLALLPGARGGDPLPAMLAGTCLIGLGSVATAALTGAFWTWLYARGNPRRGGSGAALSLLGAIPYVAFALVVRALVCKPVAFLAAGRFLALRPDDRLAYDSMLGAAPGLLAASLALGLAVGRGLWAWLERVRAAEEASESFLAATVRGERPWEIVLRHGVWLRRRRELGALLLSGMAAAALIDVLSNALIDSFRGAGFPPYPSLGAALFLRGLGDDGAPAPFPLNWSVAHVVIIVAALLLVLAQALPLRARRISLSDMTLRVNRTTIARGVPGAFALAARPAAQWVLGESGAGKSMLLSAWREQLPDAVLVPQDPDDALPASLSAADLARLGGERFSKAVSDLLGRFDDPRLQRRLADPFTPVAAFSRGERQRLLLAMALARARLDPKTTLLLDEPTSAQDAQRAHALVEALRELLDSRGEGGLVITSHDAERIDAMLRDQDQLVWLSGGAASSMQVAEKSGSAGVSRYLLAVERLLEAREAEGAVALPIGQGLRVLPAALDIGERRHTISPEARLRAGELTVLSGPSGSGKTTLLRAICRAAPAHVGYVAQDTARAYPAQMPVAEMLAADREPLRHWFGGELSDGALRRSIGALSEGERQRVVLASEVLRLEKLPGLRVLLLDEPFGALDPPAHLRLMDALLGWLRGAPQRAAVLVSHSPLVDLGLARASGVPAVEWIIEGEAEA